ncbi:unnamed protein product [Symbiodinium natans]|uniref:Endonuclease/exonuclease/phosphatase domain-containing protein n=1 Tax=Symbiodinium natans TaxID=878477 RepID=A0A812U8D6_9DINO|nr:unnamed protein product [Symbiodinium natans]
MAAGDPKTEVAAPRFEFIGDLVSPERESDSDHNALLCRVQRPGGELALVSWNVLCKFGFNERFGFPYDGFNRRYESEAAYLERLARVSEKVKAFAKTYQPDVILIQENANATKNEFGYEALPKMLAPLQEQHYMIFQEAEFITAVRDGSRSSFTLDLELQRMQGKVHAVRSPDLNAVILNVHLTFDQHGSENSRKTRRDLEAICELCSEKFPGASIILAGDTNRVPQQDRLDGAAEVIEQLVDGLGILYMPPGPTNVRYDCKREQSEFTYADFVADLTVHT